MIKFNSLLYKSNKFNYGQILINNKVILTNRSDLHITENLNIREKKILNLYNKKIISYSTFKYLLSKIDNNFNKKNYFFFKIMGELVWESGLLKKSKNIIFIKK